MSRRQLLIAGLIALAVTVLCVFVLDVPIARAVGTPSAAVARPVRALTSAMELVSLMTIDKFALGGVLVIAALIAWAVRAWRAAYAPLLFVGLSHLTARLVAGVLKNVFGRLRPLEAPSWHDVFFDGGGSMPSGHAVHFWALFFALALLFPRARWLLLAPAVLISLARVLVNDHYVGDVIASAAIAAFSAWAWAPIVQRSRVITS